ncbi:MAG TPA: AsmA-like C-terminal region-containing protein, partial [Bacteroidales bacterium]|nr:AsmA-like C-terminal region-containing protein [Bacteroidales bacterium]
DAGGLLSSEGSIRGRYDASHIPLLTIHVVYEKGTIKYPGLSFPLHDIFGDLDIKTDLISDSLSSVRINRFTAKTPASVITSRGVVNHLFRDISCDLTTDAGLTLDEFNSMIPDTIKTVISGKVSGQVRTKFTLSQLEKMQFEKMKLSGKLALSDFSVKYDSLSLETGKSDVEFSMPNKKPQSNKTQFLFASIISDNIEAGKTEGYNAFLKKSSIYLETSDIRDTGRIPDVQCSFSMDSISAGMDNMALSIHSPRGKMSLAAGEENGGQPRISLVYNSGELRSSMGGNTATVKKISTDLDIINDDTQKDIFLQWLVKGYVDIDHGFITLSGVTNPFDIPSIKMDFDPENFRIKESRMLIGNSDFHLSGNMNNVLSYFRGDSVLRGKFKFVSDRTDLAQLMALTSGIGSSDSTGTDRGSTASSDTTATGPYLVPRNMDVVLNANVSLATFGVDTATNISGDVRVHDGVLLLDGLTFNTPAAKMQMTALYRTPRTNHLFLGIDYHMMDIEIGELLTMIPDIDTIMPMLRSFGGKGEFHFCAETYLDSLYNVKKSTLRGSAAITGTNLVLMDGETFSEIAKKLRFNKKTENKVDSLSAEFTIFRNEIDVYPFLIVMDKYKAVVSGRHNLDMTFDYHISVVDCPLPIKLGIDIKGDVDNMSYSLAKCKYAQYFRPTSRHAVEAKRLELRKMIRDALAGKV